MSSAPPERKPWPIKWIVLAIVLFIAGYTFLNLHYRKPGRAYRPYDDMKSRANTARLLAAGYQRVQLAAEQPVEPAGLPGNTMPAPGGLPAELRTTLVSPPLLADEIVGAHAGGTASRQQPYQIRFRCRAPDDKQQIAGADLYAKGDRIVVVPRFDRLTGGLQSRTREYLVVLTVPAGALRPGRYGVTLIGRRSSMAWSLEVR